MHGLKADVEQRCDCSSSHSSKGVSSGHAESFSNTPFGKYNDTDLLMPSGNIPFRRALAVHAAISVITQGRSLRPSLSFSTKDFELISDYEEKGTTAAWVQSGLSMALRSGAIEEEESAYLAAHCVQDSSAPCMSSHHTSRHLSKDKVVRDANALRNVAFSSLDA
ncbi:TPA: hypothetical protein ACH3X3_000303 [Trebouxia sp. C0006]